MRFYLKLSCLLLLVIFSSCSKDDDGSYQTLVPDENEVYSGGKNNTSFNFSAEAFGFASPELSFDERVTFGVGNSFFNQSWVTAPASTTARDGLGPFFNARNCSACHFKDGRGQPPAFDGEISQGLLLRLSVPGDNPHGGPAPAPVYGGQFQDNAILDVDKEGGIRVDYQSTTETYDDGTEVELQDPVYSFTDLNYGEMAGNVQVSPRIANQMIGLGLLDAIPETTLMRFSDPSDSNNDGVSGRINKVYDIESNTMAIGRFGWKANQPNIKQQVAAAFAGDMGITNSLMPDKNCPDNFDCGDIPNGGSPEISDENLDKVTFYASTLAVPARRDVDDEEVLKGKKLFGDAMCTKCHKAKIQTGPYSIDALANQTIRPYTDLLLHDMGEALADHAKDYKATGREWRTQPLWGIGLIETVNGHTNLLHDGRARNIEEAILWHGGEAEASKNAFKALFKNERNRVIKFINSL